MVENMLLSLTLSACLCLGLPSVIWTLFSLRKYQDAGGTITAFTVAFIGSDVLELVISPFVGTMLLEGYDSNCHLPCWALYSGLSVARTCGLQLHQLVALEGILTLVYTQYFVSFPCSSVLSVTVWIFVITIHFFSVGYTINFIFCVVPVAVAITVSGFIIRLELLSYRSVRHRHPGLPVIAVSMLILVVLYMPTLILTGLVYPEPFYVIPWSTVAVSIMSFRVVIEPLWCVWLYREIQKCKASLHLEGTNFCTIS